MMKPALDIKTPNEVKDYAIDWTAQLGDGTTITDSAWEIVTALGSPDLVIDTEDIDGLSTLVRLSGGEAGRDYSLNNLITTSAGEELEAAIQVRVRNAPEAAGIYD